MAGSTEDIAVLLVRLEARITDFEKAMTRAENRANEANKKITSTFTSLNHNISRAFDALRRGVEAVGGALSVRFLVDFVKDAVRAGLAIEDGAKKLQISAEAFQELGYAATQAGASVDDLEPAFKAMQKFLGDARDQSKRTTDELLALGLAGAGIFRGTTTAVSQLKALGLTLDDLKGKTPDEQFKILLDAIGKIPDATQRANAITTVFGKAAQNLGPLAELGAEGIDKLVVQAHKLGIILSNETIGQASDAAHAIDEILAVLDVSRISIASGFADVIERLRDAVTDPAFQDSLKALAKNIGDFVTSLTSIDPHILELLLSAAVGKATFGPIGALLAAVGDLSKQLTEFGIQSLGRQLGVEPALKGDRLVPTHTGPFGSEFFTPTMKTMRGLQEAARKAGEGPPGPSATDIEHAKDLDNEYKNIAASLELQTANLHKSNKEQFIANEVAKLSVDQTPEHVASIKALAGALYDQQQAQQAVNEATAFFAETAFDAFDKLISGAENFKDVLGDVLKALERAVLQSLLLGQGPLAGLFGTAPTGSGTVGGILGNLIGSLFRGGRQSGGPVMAGRAYRVGEHGPELFMPNVSGQIIPPDKGAGAALVQLHVVPSQYFDVTVDQRSAVQAQKISVEVVRTTGKAQARRRELSE